MLVSCCLSNAHLYVQHSCGSCYSVAATYALQRRYQIAVNATDPSAAARMFERNGISPQATVSCSFYNQGCNGGYPYLVGKWAHDSGLHDSRCQAYSGTDDICPYSEKKSITQDESSFLRVSDRSACHDGNKWYAANYGYVGGAYEKCNERAIMEEVFRAGPVAAAMDTPGQIFSYSDGVFDTRPAKHTRTCEDNLGGLNGWEYTNHAIAIVGWGEKQGSDGQLKKYWVVRNSWGPSWGKKGYMMFARGKNLAGIESQAVFLDPDFTRGRGREYSKSTQKSQLPTTRISAIARRHVGAGR
eukprot:GHVU01138207.1.p1 GENE.GHVU01138207.1~~GHVU01138207.1.p1  ORF type:complete len:300 (-),score=14.60 GHVU01138207.1:236-1135(-)